MSAPIGTGTRPARPRTRSRPRALRAGPVGRQARILALQVLFAADVKGVSDAELLEWLCAEEPAGPSVRRTAADMVDKVTEQLDRLDGTIQRLAPAIPVNLLAAVDRNILRVAIYELVNRDTVPRQVVVNEAVELAFMFGSASSARFVNGVLATLLVELSAAANSPTPSATHPAADDLN